MAIDIAELCALLEAPLPAATPGSAALRFHGVSTLALAAATDLCFAEIPDQADAILASRAGAVIVPLDFPELAGPVLVRTREPRKGFFRAAELFVQPSEVQGRHPSAVIDAETLLGEGVSVGACAVIAAGARIGDGCIIGPGCYLGPDVTLGTGCVIEANVTLHRGVTLGSRCIIHSGTVIGADGFGYVWDGKGHRKIPQLGRVVIEDDVEIGCNCCVDRATLGETRIRSGTKIDNLVQVAHNTDIGQHVILVSQSGVAGSSTVGTGAVIAGQVAISDHVNVGAGARVGGQSGVTKDVPAGATVFGTPARPMRDTLRELGALAQLPGLLKTLRQQSKELTSLRERLEALEGNRDG